MTNILKEEASFNKYQSSQKTSALRRSHPFDSVLWLPLEFSLLCFCAQL
jgi:hypothetical protein